MDFAVQKTVKAKLKSSFENRYPEKIVAQIKKNGSSEVPIQPVHLSITVLEELHGLKMACQNAPRSFKSK